ncbi:hypothetical protein Goshw_013622, partial [Gossypium schwendimanii]|nr:hypothetical protein [Gossypium schwendimanii]
MAMDLSEYLDRSNREYLELQRPELTGFIRGYIQEISLSQVPISSSRTMVKELWRPPNSGIIKLNFDASFKCDPKTSVVVVLARNDKGQIMGVCTYLYEGVADGFIAEARASERALLFAIEMGFRRILLEGDSLPSPPIPLVVERATKKVRNKLSNENDKKDLSDDEFDVLNSNGIELLEVVVDLDKPLKSWVGIDGTPQANEYEGLPIIYYEC